MTDDYGDLPTVMSIGGWVRETAIDVLAKADSLKEVLERAKTD
ncbi:hypothetical protein AB0395_22300 [Streptosporangium sp. NPDC051023]